MVDVEGGTVPAATGSSGAPTKSNKKLKKIWSHTPSEIFHGLLSTVTVGSSITGMVLAPSRMVIFAGICGSVVAPYAYYQQTKLTDIIALKETHEAVKREVDRLQSENVRLNETVGDLSETIDNLEEVEHALDTITQTQGQSIETYAQQVKENRSILQEMQKNLRANKLQNLLQVVIRSDQDDNMTIEEDEIDDLISRIRKINGVEVREDRFKDRIISSGGSLSSVMDIIKNLMDDVSKEDEIFIIR
eukprot:120707_1